MLATWMCQKKYKVFLLSEKTKVLDVIKEGKKKSHAGVFPGVPEQLGLSISTAGPGFNSQSEN